MKYIYLKDACHVKTQLIATNILLRITSTTPKSTLNTIIVVSMSQLTHPLQFWFSVE